MKANFKKIIVYLSLIILFMSFVGCGKTEIDGKWVLVEGTSADGKHYSQKDFELAGIYQEYVINGENIAVKIKAQGMTEPEEGEMKLEKISGNKYNFILPEDSSIIAQVKVSGDKMTVKFADSLGGNTSYFERQ